MNNYYINRENGYNAIKKVITEWYNNSKTQSINLSADIMTISLQHKVGVITLRRLIAFYISQFENTEKALNFDEKTLILKRV